MNDITKAYYSKRVEELLDGIDNGDFESEIIPDKYKWDHLLGLFLLKDSLDGAEALFTQLYDLAIKSAERYLRKKSESGETINVVFQSYSAAQWPAEGVYRRFEQTPNVNPKILVSPLVDRNKESGIDSYKKSLSWYKENGYNVEEGMNLDTLEMYEWDKLGGYPDVLYQLSSWFTSLPCTQWFSRLPLRCLVAYIPYSLYLADNNDGSFAIQVIYNKEIMNMMWRVYCDTNFNLGGYKKYELLGGRNARYTGYAKMDYFYTEHEFSDDDIKKLWKIPESKRVSEIKRIIIAPHFSIFNEGALLLSTFKKNAWFWLYLAEKYKDKVSFLFKPHPNLRWTTVEHKLFRSYEEYDEYIAKWDSLENGKAVQEAKYLDYFKTSDAMIMDSGSFLGEYLYTGKPLLFLTRPEQRFMDLGKRVVASYYNAPGENYTEIEKFIRDVVINGNDYMKPQREQLFNEEFDYVKTNGIKSCEYIYNEVYDLIKPE